MGSSCCPEVADFFYKCDELYSPSDEITIRWDDPQLNIDWRTSNPSLSARDAAAALLKDIPNLPGYETP